jgi:hypothetical protein
MKFVLRIVKLNFSTDKQYTARVKNMKSGMSTDYKLQ